MPPTCREISARHIHALTYTRWEGFYVGAQGGETFGSVNFGNATQSMVSYMLANNTDLQGIVSDWTALQKGSSGGASYGGFVGYNWQWDDVILGAELNYSHMSIGVGAQNSVGPIPIAGAPQGASTVLYSVTLTSAASLTIHDIMTARARAGWTFDRFMPYAFAGVAVGRADISSFATLAPNSTIYGDYAAWDNRPIGSAARSPNRQCSRPVCLWVYSWPRNRSCR